jgi:predicted dienelactone hydrolase
MSKQVCLLFFLVLILLASCSSQNLEPALAFVIPESELPLAEPGPYEFSVMREIIYNDDDRNGREVSIDIYYPSTDGEPDLRGAPFPLIISSYKMLVFAPHLVSHGFIAIGINYFGDDEIGAEYYQPLDYVFALNQLADNPPEVLEGMIDTDHAGAWGYSFDGRNSLVLTGARLDPEYYFEVCDNPGFNDIDYTGNLNWICEPFENWDEFVEGAGTAITESEDGLWQPITDDRIIALMPLSPDGEWLFGSRGFAAVDKAVLLTEGQYEAPFNEAHYKAYEDLGTSEKVFITFVGKTHNMIFEPDAQRIMQHLGIAFFSYHLKGNEEYEFYFSEEFISQVEGLAWGWYEE